MKLANLALGASLFAGLFAAPAWAASITNPTLGGANDVILYNSNGVNTFADPGASLDAILAGNASNPGGNVELFASSEQPGANFNTPTTLSGTLNGTSITLSSLTAADWDVFGVQWFSEFLDAAVTSTGRTLAGLAGYSDLALYDIFVDAGGREFFSDPNISYVNQDDTTGEVTIGLAGHLNARDRILGILPPAIPSPFGPIPVAGLLNPEIQASEIVKVLYGDQPARYLWSFSATASGLVEAGDGVSHDGNYEVKFQGNLPEHPPEAVPEPATVLGLVALGGVLVAAKRKSTVG